jgi:cell wall-associated NlpC family hydrolase
LFAVFVFIIMRSEAAAQESRVHRAKDAVIALQPFSLDEPAPVRLAYYAPRPIPRAAPVSEEDEGEAIPQIETSNSHPVVAGSRAVLRDGIAYAPSDAPERVKSAIWAANTLRRKPYVWGGGHGSFNDYGYDCSGAVSYALHHASLLDTPLPSSDFLRYGERGRGRWITIYARHGHTFAVIAGLRLDTTDLRYGGDVGPRWYVDGRDTRDFAARHPVGM